MNSSDGWLKVVRLRALQLGKTQVEMIYQNSVCQFSQEVVVHKQVDSLDKQAPIHARNCAGRWTGGWNALPRGFDWFQLRAAFFHWEQKVEVFEFASDMGYMSSDEGFWQVQPSSGPQSPTWSCRRHWQLEVLQLPNFDEHFSGVVERAN